MGKVTAHSAEDEVRCVFGRAMAMEELGENPALALKFTAIVMEARSVGYLGHELCLALRYALFGSGADDRSSILVLSSMACPYVGDDE